MIKFIRKNLSLKYYKQRVKYLRTSETVPSYKGKYVYDAEIDNAIVNILKNTGKVSSGKLKIEVEKKVRRTISPCTYSTHISNLIDQKVLAKEDLGRGKSMYYSLIESAEKKLELGLLGNNESEIELFRRVYNVIFFYHVFYHYPKIVFSEAEFREFLIMIGSKENELIWSLIADGHNHESVEIAYGRIKESLRMSNTPIERYERICNEYWKDRRGQTTVLSSIKLTCYPLKNNLDSCYIDRFEHWEINKKLPNRILFTEYHLNLCGFSVDDIIEASGADRGSVNHAIENLEKLKLVKPIIFYDGLPKYRFKDGEFEGLFKAIWDIHAKAEIVLLFKKWCFIEKPTQDELDRLERLVGKNERQRTELLCDRIRTQTKLALKHSRTIHQFIKYIKENASFFWKLLEYPYEIPNTFAEYTAHLQDYTRGSYKKELPQRLHRIFSEYERFKKLVPKELILHIRAENEQTTEEPFSFLYYTLESFNRNKDKLSVHTADKVIDFYRYFQYMLNQRLENPSYNDEYMEEIKIQFTEVIMKYPFLEGIINDVCPKILSTQNEDNEKELVYIVSEKIGNEITTGEMREMSEIHEFESRLISNKIPFSYSKEELYNPASQKIEDRRSFRIWNQNDLCKNKVLVGFYTLELVYDPETQKSKYEPVFHRNDLYQIRKPSNRQIKQFQAKLRSKTRRVVYVIKQKIKGKLISHEIRDESKIREFEDSLKSGTAFHYDVKETFNPSTQEIEDRKIFRLLDQKDIESGEFSSVHIIKKVYNPITQRKEDVPVIHFLDTKKNLTTKKKSKKSRISS